MPDPRNPMRRNGFRRARRSHAPPHRMNAGTEATLVAAAMIPTLKRFPPNAYAKSGIRVDVATAPSANTLRIGFLPNVTHATALFGIATGIYQRAFGSEFAVQSRAYNAGPDAISALLTQQVDLVFVGPSPTLNGLAVAGPDVLRVVAGAASGGAFFLIQPYVNLTTDAGLRGKKIATPPSPNTPDIPPQTQLL